MSDATTSADPFLHDLIDRLHDTPMQRKLRRIAPMPVGCVFLPWPGMSEDDARKHFRLMRRLGFTCLKQTMGTAEWPVERTLALALDEGIIPFWYAEGGYEDITPELLQRLGLPADMDVDAALEHPAMVAYQHGRISERIGRTRKAAHVAGNGGEAGGKPKDWVPGVVGDVQGHELHPEAIPAFVAWLKQRYGTVAGLQQAWNFQHVGIGDERLLAWTTWDDVAAAWKAGFRTKDYSHMLDVMRFRSEQFIRQYVTAAVDRQQEIDPHEPVRAGGEMGLFLPFASRATDMEGMALEMARGGSFYPSIHLTWHFEEVAYEVARPIYMQASISADWAKGIWSATWESTGGPNYFSGGKAPFVAEAQSTTPGSTCDAGTMTQLMLSYLAAGFRGFGLWAWNHRTAGWEAGEYAVLDRNREPGERAFRVGAIGIAAKRWRRELWQAHKEPLVGVLHDWDSEAMWAAMSVQGRDKYKNEPVRGRIGISRCLIDGNVPWEHVTTRQLAAGLGPRYRVIYVPTHIAISARLLELLTAYVEQGGRLVLDMPGAYYDGSGVIFPTGPGTAWERLFGAAINEFGYSNRLEQTYTVDGVAIDGFTALVTPTTARTAAVFPHNGKPAVTENRCGTGTAVLLAWQGALSCYRPGNAALQALILKHALGPHQSPYACDGALAYRQAAPAADHWFLINPDPAKSVVLRPHAYRYRSCIDVLTGQPVDLARPIALEGHSGRWLRAERA